MARLIATSTLRDTIGYSLGDGNNLTVTFGTDVSSLQSYGVTSTGSDQLVYVAGGVSGALGGILMGDDGLDQNARIVVASTGFVTGGSNLTSAGVIFEGQSVSLLNRGVILGAVGVDLTTGGEIRSQILNTGRILGSSYGVLRSDAFGIGPATLVLTNTGVISGALASYDSILGGRLVSDQIFNGGTMRGNIFLGGGADLYSGTTGRVLGNIYGGDGDDVFRPGRFLDLVYGGDGIDTIDFRFSKTVTVNLTTPGLNAGDALGDTYADIENIVGSNLGNDRITGDAGENFIAGLGGADLLDGSGGTDTLAGGLGKDTLIGGNGDDVFLLRSPGDGADVISDFSRVAGNTDVIHLRGTFFGGLLPGVMNVDIFRVSTSATAGDVDDRFIFRTTDNTLWYDVDGTGRRAAVMIADFAAGVLLTSTDFLII